jgi:hypothetical protein
MACSRQTPRCVRLPSPSGVRWRTQPAHRPRSVHRLQRRSPGRGRRRATSGPCCRQRLLESLPLVCPNCGADMRIIAFITEAAPVEQILTHIGEPPRRPGAAAAGACSAPSCPVCRALLPIAAKKAMSARGRILPVFEPWSGSATRQWRACGVVVPPSAVRRLPTVGSQFDRGE